MIGAIFYSTRYGSTAQYARWIAEATGLPAFDVDEESANPADYDFVVLGAPVIYHKLMLRKWVKRNRASLLDRPVILFSVSGAGAGRKLDGWLAKSLPSELLAHVEHFALRGRQDPADLSRFDRMMLIVGGWTNPDRAAGREERKGFDYIDKASIEPVIEAVARLHAARAPAPDRTATSR